MSHSQSSSETDRGRDWPALRRLHEEQVALLEDAVQLAREQRERLIQRDAEGMGELFRREAELLRRLRQIQALMRDQAGPHPREASASPGPETRLPLLQEEVLRLASLARHEFAVNADLLANGLGVVDHFFQTVSRVARREAPPACGASALWLDESA